MDRAQLLAVIRIIVGSVIAISATALCGPAQAEECAAPAKWFKSSGAPTPATTEPKRGNDCEFYQRAWQTFLYSTQPVDGTPRFLTSTFKSYGQVFGPDKPAGFLATHGDVMVLAPRNIETAQVTDAEDVFQAGSNSILIDQRGEPIFYNIVMNPKFVNFIIKNGYNDVKKLIAAPPAQELPEGVVEYKAAWQIIDGSANSDHRITRPAMVPWLVSDGNGKLKVDPSRELRPVTVAMIGLHVVFRTKGHPEMIWATFEYNGNAPSLAGNPKGQCVNAGETVDETVVENLKSYALFSLGTPYEETNKRPQSLSVVDDAKQVFSPKNNIVRAFPFSGCFPGANTNNAIKEIDGAIVSLNRHVLEGLKTDDRKVYSLVGAVWLDEPNSPHDNLGFKEGESFDDFQLGGENRLSSTSMESMTQTSSPNCFSCHDTHEKGNLGDKRLNVSHIFRRFSLQD